MEVIIGLLGVIALVLLVIAYGAIAWGIVTYYFWGWFILPVFTTMPHLNLVQAIGVSTFIMLFGRTTGDSIKKEYKDASNKVLGWLKPWIVLLVGWLVSLAM